MAAIFGPKLGLVINDSYDDEYVDDLRAAFRGYDALLNCTVKSVVTTAPPGSPSNGDAYFLSAGNGACTGAWAGNEGKLAVWVTGVTSGTGNTPVAPAWEFYDLPDSFSIVESSGDFNIVTAIAGQAYCFNPFYSPTLIGGDTWDSRNINVGYVTINSDNSGGLNLVNKGAPSVTATLFLSATQLDLNTSAGTDVEVGAGGISAFGISGDDGSVTFNTPVSLESWFVDASDSTATSAAGVLPITSGTTTIQNTDTVTSITGVPTGAYVTLFAASGQTPTIQHGANIKLAGGSNLTFGSVYTNITLLNRGGVLVETSRSVIP